MDAIEGFALAEFVNRESSRFLARILTYGQGKCWVLVADEDTLDKHGNAFVFEPIADFDHYVNRVEQSYQQFPQEYLCLLRQWNAAYIATP